MLLHNWASIGKRCICGLGASSSTGCCRFWSATNQRSPTSKERRTQEAPGRSHHQALGVGPARAGGRLLWSEDRLLPGAGVWGASLGAQDLRDPEGEVRHLLQVEEAGASGTGTSQAQGPREVLQLDTIDFGGLFAFTAIDIYTKEADILVAPALTARYPAGRTNSLSPPGRTASMGTCNSSRLMVAASLRRYSCSA